MDITARNNKDNIARSGNPDYINYEGNNVLLQSFPEILHFLFIYKNRKPKTFSMKVLLMQTPK